MVGFSLGCCWLWWVAGGGGGDYVVGMMDRERGTERSEFNSLNNMFGYLLKKKKKKSLAQIFDLVFTAFDSKVVEHTSQNGNSITKVHTREIFSLNSSFIFLSAIIIFLFNFST